MNNTDRDADLEKLLGDVMRISGGKLPSVTEGREVCAAIRAHFRAETERLMLDYTRLSGTKYERQSATRQPQSLRLIGPDTDDIGSRWPSK